ncbi:MAG TPA: DUF481 domain-containing protein [Vicinamibacterales bacterium]
MLFVLANGTALVAKRQDDRLVMNNGDSKVGEIKKLAQGVLSFKADYELSAAEVDWAQVQTLRSLDAFQVSTADGRRLTGPIERFANGDFTVTVAGQGTVTLAWYDVVTMVPVETSFWAQLTGNIDSGFSYTSGNSQTQFSASGALGYAASQYTFGMTGSSTFSGQSDGTSTSRNTINILNQLRLRPKWFGVALVDLLNSEQQDLDLRTTLGGAIGRWLVLTSKTEFAALGGVVYTHEQYSAPPDPTQPGSDITNNVEALLGLDLSIFHFKTMQINSKFTVYPSITTFGRVRLNYAPTLNLEIAHNLYWSFTLYENYDSRPPVNANKNDFGVTNSIGWKF